MCDVCERRVHTHGLWGRRAAGASLSLGSCIFCSLSFFDVVLTLFILCFCIYYETPYGFGTLIVTCLVGD